MEKEFGSNSLHQMLKQHYREFFPLKDVGNLRSIIEYTSLSRLFIEGHGTFTGG